MMISATATSTAAAQVMGVGVMGHMMVATMVAMVATVTEIAQVVAEITEIAHQRRRDRRSGHDLMGWRLDEQRRRYDGGRSAMHCVQLMMGHHHGAEQQHLIDGD